MFNLVPSYTYDVNQLFRFIIKRNELLIRLRYYASAGIGMFIIFSYFILEINFTSSQLLALFVTNIFILFYNIVFNIINESDIIKTEKNGFNPLHFSLLQIVLDLLCLGILTYFTGGIESPFFIFFVLHMIIGSLLLPWFVIYSLAIIIVLWFSLNSVLEYLSIIPHHKIAGLFDFSLYDNIYYIIIFLSAFSVVMFASVYLANSIARSWSLREQELSIALNKLSEAEKIKQKYTIGVVHEIKTPISAVQSNLDIVLQKYVGPISPSVEEKLTRARVRTDEAIQIINDILKISKLKLTEEIKKEHIDISALTEKVIANRKSQAEYGNQSLYLYDLRHDKKPISGDLYMLELAISNLIGNALKYTNSGGTIEVVLDNIRNNKELLIEVCDNGIGIPESDQSKIFNEFFRAGNVKQKSYEGTGLGLTVVKQIVEQHHGKISFQSPSRLADDKGKGTCFKIILPLAEKDKK